LEEINGDLLEAELAAWTVAVCTGQTPAPEPESPKRPEAFASANIFLSAATLDLWKSPNITQFLTHFHSINKLNILFTMIYKQTQRT